MKPFSNLKESRGKDQFLLEFRSSQEEEIVLLDGVNHLCLKLRRQVVVNYTKSSEELCEGSCVHQFSTRLRESEAQFERTAIAIAISVSVTVSIGDERKGVLSTVFLVTLDSVETAEAGKSI